MQLKNMRDLIFSTNYMSQLIHEYLEEVENEMPTNVIEKVTCEFCKQNSIPTAYKTYLVGFDFFLCKT